MSKIALTEEQMAILNSTTDPVEITDSKGNELGYVHPPLTPEHIAELKRRAASPGPWFTGAQIQARLKALEEEWERTGGFDEEYATEFLKRLDEADPGHWRDQTDHEVQRQLAS